jgi:hypothetical protein
MSENNVRYHRGSLSIDGRDVKVRPLGSGMFSKAYVTTGRGTPKVYLLTNTDDSGDWSKQAMAEMYRDGDRSRYIPRLEFVGTTYNSYVYRMPLYDAPLKKANSEKAWAQYRVLKRCWDEAEADMRAHFGQRASSPYNGHWQMNAVVDCADADRGVPAGLVTALEMLRDGVANYGSDYSFEFSPRNLATTKRGGLILLDVVFSRLSVQRQRAAASRRRRY